MPRPLVRPETGAAPVRMPRICNQHRGCGGRCAAAGSARTARRAPGNVAVVTDSDAWSSIPRFRCRRPRPKEERQPPSGGPAAMTTPATVLYLDQTTGNQHDETDPSQTLLSEWGFTEPTDFASTASTPQSFSQPSDSISFQLQAGNDTGLTSLDGSPILLSAAKTAANGDTYFDAVVSGGAYDGEVAFRLVYVPTYNSDSQVTGYTLYTLLYNDAAPIRHGDPANPNDLATMTALVEALLTVDLQFVYSDFSGIPAGQQAFGVLKEPSLDPDPSPGISNDVVITSKVFNGTTWVDGTINTSNVAGTASAIGVGSQAVGTNEAVIYDFVTNATYTDSKNLDTLDITGAVSANRAFSTVTQLNPNNANTRADVRVWLRDGDPGAAMFDGADNTGIKTVYLYLNGNYTEAAYTIPSSGGNWTGPGGLSVTFENSDGDAAYEYAVIKGLKAGDRFEVEGDTQFNRLVVGNAGTGNRTFDLGVTGYSIDSSETTGQLLGGIGIYDDGPSLSAIGVGDTTLTLDESPLPTAGDGLLSDSVVFGTAAYFNDPDYGADKQGADPATYALALSADGLGSGLFALDLANTTNGKGSEILLYNNAGTIEGRIDGTTYFTIAVNSATGEVTFTREKNIWHGNANNHDDAESLVVSGGTLMLRKTVKDGDLDPATADLNLGNGVFEIEDDGPAFLFPAGKTAVELLSAAGPTAQTEEVLDWDPGTDGFRKLDLANFSGTATPGNGGFSVSDPVVSEDGTSISLDVSYGGQKIASHVFNADGDDTFTTYKYEGQVLIEPTQLEAGAAVKAGGPHPLEFRLFPDPQALAIMVTGGTRTSSEDETDPFTPGQLNTSAQGYAAGNTNQNLEFREAIKFTFTEHGAYDYNGMAAQAAADFKAGTYSEPVPGVDMGDYKAEGGFGFDITKLTGGAKVADFIAKATFELEGGGTTDVYFQFTDVGVNTKHNPKVFVGYDMLTGWTAYTWKDANGNSLRDGDPLEALNGKAELIHGGALPDNITGLDALEIYNNDVDGKSDTFNVTNPRFYSLGSRTEVVPEFNYSFDLNLYDLDFDTTTASINAKIDGKNTGSMSEQLLLGQSSLV
ncbi:DUF5801 repeats-in-toxin domain-containing protein [Cyanobium sp. CH-040]|uniref:DUF5801 repeats-in-toxin domain-containing protein n=1 Tax=Cyanobium sp. CH-040 TaxID=2823708 RepID=UPI0020CBE299|nr:DUF5801 repeats-in-toxin domain-containing protein [Cyanobium sp. CH-040]MCP9928468.1 hypothetical protein [Cyanobium sp. CH-040]